jgi:hypothetical protein
VRQTPVDHRNGGITNASDGSQAGSVSPSSVASKNEEPELKE